MTWGSFHIVWFFFSRLVALSLNLNFFKWVVYQLPILIIIEFSKICRLRNSGNINNQVTLAIMNPSNSACQVVTLANHGYFVFVFCLFVFIIIIIIFYFLFFVCFIFYVKFALIHILKIFLTGLDIEFKSEFFFIIHLIRIKW